MLGFVWKASLDRDSGSIPDERFPNLVGFQSRKDGNAMEFKEFERTMARLGATSKHLVMNSGGNYVPVGSEDDNIKDERKRCYRFEAKKQGCVYSSNSYSNRITVFQYQGHRTRVFDPREVLA